MNPTISRIAVIVIIIIIAVFIGVSVFASQPVPHHFHYGTPTYGECVQTKCGDCAGTQEKTKVCNVLQPGWATGNPSDCQEGNVVKEIVACEVKEPTQCEVEGVCPTECGYQGGEVADGQGGYKVCEATEACVIPPTPKAHGKAEKADCHLPREMMGFRPFGTDTLKWNERDNVRKVDITAYANDKATVLWKLRTDDDGEFNLGGLSGTWFEARGMNACGLGKWSKMISF